MSNVPNYTNPTDLSSEVSDNNRDSDCFNTSYSQPEPSGINDIRSFDNDHLGVKF